MYVSVYILKKKQKEEKSCTKGSNYVMVMNILMKIQAEPLTLAVNAIHKCQKQVVVNDLLHATLFTLLRCELFL